MDDMISRQAAIETVSKGCAELRGVFGRCEENILALPSAQPDVPDTNVGDMISRQAAMDEVESIVDTMSVCISMDEYKGMRRMKENVLERLKALPSAQPGCEDEKALKTAFLRMASYVDSLLECSDEQKETLINLIAKVADYMPWSPHDAELPEPWEGDTDAH